MATYQVIVRTDKPFDQQKREALVEFLTQLFDGEVDAVIRRLGEPIPVPKNEDPEEPA